MSLTGDNKQLMIIDSQVKDWQKLVSGTNNTYSTVIYNTDFESSVGTEWSTNTKDNTYPSIFSNFLGRFNSSSAELTLSTIQGQSYLLEFDLYAIDSWDGNQEQDYFNVLINNQQVFHETLTNNSGNTQSFRQPDSGGIGVNLGFVNSYSDAIYRKIPIAFTATGTSTLIKFADSHLFTAGLTDESWGIDNVKVTTVATNTAPSFSLTGDGKTITAVGISEDIAYTLALQLDGKILVVGSSFNGSNNDFALIRYNNNGILDSSFGGTGKIITNLGTGNDIGSGVAVQSDGKIIVAGQGWNGSSYDFAIVRYNSDGTLDSSFDGDGKVFTDFSGSNEAAYSVIVQSDGKILVAGSSNNSGNFALARYNSDGSLDSSFDGDGKVITSLSPSTSVGQSVILQADGKILVAGWSLDSRPYYYPTLIRYNSNGSLDTSFNGNGIVTTSLVYGQHPQGSALGESVAVQTDGKIVVAGYIFNGSNQDCALLRYNNDGSLDTSFNGNGIVTTAIGNSDDYWRSVTVQTDGKILVGGYYVWNDGNKDYDFVLARYNNNGSLDTSFNGTGIVTTALGSLQDIAYAVTVQADGKILIAGTSNSDFALVRYNSNGSLDTTFDAVNTLNATPSYTENSSAVVLDNSVQIGSPYNSMQVVIFIDF